MSSRAKKKVQGSAVKKRKLELDALNELSGEDLIKRAPDLWLWCLHCERTFKARELVSVVYKYADGALEEDPHEGCPHDGCNGALMGGDIWIYELHAQDHWPRVDDLKGGDHISLYEQVEPGFVEWFLYTMGPLDLGWELLDRCDIADVPSEIQEAAGSKLGWEGDVRENSCARFFIPDDTEVCVGFVWKQDNNGTCFVASTRLLDHLEKADDPVVVRTALQTYNRVLESASLPLETPADRPRQDARSSSKTRTGIMIVSRSDGQNGGVEIMGNTAYPSYVKLFTNDVDQWAVETNCPDEDTFRRHFTSELMVAIFRHRRDQGSLAGERAESFVKREESHLRCIDEWLKHYAEITCKYRGYRADVYERRTICSGWMDPPDEAQVKKSNGNGIAEKTP